MYHYIFTFVILIYAASISQAYFNKFLLLHKVAICRVIDPNILAVLFRWSPDVVTKIICHSWSIGEACFGFDIVTFDDPGV